MSYQNECQQILDVFETELRGFVCKQLETLIGAGWWKTRVPGPIKQSCRQRRIQDQNRPFPPLPTGEDVDYIHIGELKDIIVRADNYKEVFSEFFGSNSNGITTKLEELIATRDAVRHVRPGIGAREHERLIVTCRDVFDAMILDIDTKPNLKIFSMGTGESQPGDENDPIMKTIR
ncbi:MAG: hypothetical protein BZY87_08720 [SAR202 cluster bacterium Io17-Chloro-G6]|nr:MAG: hypothetical protein BZY87_08720 [SAR202 cluster bacterium Io17-Chloro-G6]